MLFQWNAGSTGHLSEGGPSWPREVEGVLQSK